MKRASTTLALAAAVTVLCKPTEVSGNTSRSEMLARRRLQADDTIPVVGVTAYPLPDPDDPAAAGDELVSTEVVDEVTDNLEVDEQVTVISSVQLGALDCSSLPAAENAPQLQFLVQANETIIAEETSFTTIPGAILPDGNSRFTWTGVVTEPAPSVNQSEPSTVSMSWGEDCDAESFLWKQTTRLLDGTTLVLKSIPCEAGAIDDICLVEVSLDLEEETPPPEANSTTTSSFTDTGAAGRMLRGATNTFPAEAIDRSLQGGVTVTVAMMYSQAALELLGAVTPAQMVTTIVDGIATSNLALKDSDIPMVFELAYVGLIPYTPSESSFIALPELRTDAEVADTRDQYEADLVQLVGALTGSCGRGYYYVPGDRTTGFSVVSPNCIDGLSHTHEFGHNLGCRHNRESTTSVTEYSHGTRYCDDDILEDERYRTIMAYTCPGQVTPRVNLFSNPDISYLGRVTGTETEDNARTIADNMADVSTWSGPASPPTPAPTTPAPSTEEPPTPAPTPAPVNNPDGYSGGECYVDSSSNRVLSGPSFKKDPDMTVETCAVLCKDIGSAYFGVQFGQECFCSAEGDDPFELGESTDCTFDCAGDDSQTCGGRNAMNIYEFDSEYEFLGCFADSSSARVLTGPSKKRDSTMTAAVCSAFCGDVPFFGTQFGNECFCGEGGDDPDALGDATCDMACAGDSSEICGGRNAISVYTNDVIIDITDATPRGCWTDLSSDRIFGAIFESSDDMTTELCESLCIGSAFYGTQFSKECFCGDDPDYERHGSSTGCNMACAGDAEDTCGGRNAMNVYEY